MVDYPDGNRFDQRGARGRWKPINRFMRAGRQFARQDFKQRLHRFISPFEPFDFPDGVKNRRVVTAIVESSDLWQTPVPHMLRKIHRYVPAEARPRCFAGNSPGAKMRRYDLLDSSQRYLQISIRSRAVGI